ncbi:MAG: hemolysin family protein [Phycisphaerae bacterium]
MGSWIYLVEGLISLLLLMAATLNLALRLPSRSRYVDSFEKVGKGHLLEGFVSKRIQYSVSTAIVRAAAKVAIVAVIFQHMGAFAGETTVSLVLGAAVLSWLLILLIAVAIPNAWSKYCGPWLVARFLPLLHAFDVVMWPIARTLGIFDPIIRRLAGVPIQDAKAFADELERQLLDVVSEGERHGAMDEEEKEMIESVIEFSEIQVEEIMTPRTEMIALPADCSLDDIMENIRTQGHSRIPIYDDTVDSILGILYVKDLLRRNPTDPFDIRKTMRQALFIPESKLVRELLREFQEQKFSIAIVLDEYGGTAGLITIEDIVEELVGDITDEYEDEQTSELERIDDLTVEVDARMRIDELNDELDINLPEDEDYETIGGFVFATMGKIPAAGETCEFADLSIKVVAAEARRITRVRLNLPLPRSQPGENGAA